MRVSGSSPRLGAARSALPVRAGRPPWRLRLHIDVEAPTWDLWSAADRIFGGWCSDDGFCYFGLWVVGLGREAFTTAVANPDALADVSEIQRLVGRPRQMWNDDWPQWESLDYVAMEAYGLLAGVDDACGEAFYEAVGAEEGDGAGSSGPLGERWDARCETDVARRLPRLSAMFPSRSLT
ncbi:DUF4240 domain-containing protein [Streptomyces sp. NPDC046182]|uniref:DUF4240 domain-containing protein n=1 Tax=Streptomyces sp. NPDC046182 TaxID=3154601 RepID=UPI0034069C64